MTQLKANFPIYVDKDGSPLDGGSIYFGIAGMNPETNPIVVYSDIDHTLPIAQPVKTVAGSAVSNGAQVRVYAPVLNYSSVVKNRRGEAVHSVLNYISTAEEASAAKVSKTGDTMTGPLSVPAGATGAEVPQAQEVGALADAQLSTHYKQSNIVGAVSQSGGVPTGAIVESGTNANGYYVRFADGTQICTKKVVSSASAYTNINWAASFINTTYSVTGTSSSSSTTTPVTVKFYNHATTYVTFACFDNTGAYSGVAADIIAIGRWY